MDNVPQFTLDRQGITDYFFEIKNLNGDRLIVVNYRYGEDYENGWLQYIFIETKQKVNVTNTIYGSRKRLAKLLAKEGLIEDGEINREKVDELILTKEINTPQKLEVKITN